MMRWWHGCGEGSAVEEEPFSNGIDDAVCLGGVTSGRAPVPKEQRRQQITEYTGGAVGRALSAAGEPLPSLPSGWVLGKLFFAAASLAAHGHATHLHLVNRAEVDKPRPTKHVFPPLYKLHAWRLGPAPALSSKACRLSASSIVARRKDVCKPAEHGGCGEGVRGREVDIERKEAMKASAQQRRAREGNSQAGPRVHEREQETRK